MRATIWLLVLLAAASCAEAATITVRRDGTGDYLTIQPALDATAEGDTVSIGPGVYTETEAVPGMGFVVFGRITQSRLTIVGAGVEATVIGPAVFAPDFQSGSPMGIASPAIHAQVAMRNLTIRNCYNGVAINGSLQLDDCHFDGNDTAIWVNSSAQDNFVNGCLVRGAVSVHATSLAMWGGGHYAVDNCEFVQASPYLANATAEFRGCISRGPSRLGFLVSVGHCVIRDCRIYEVEVGFSTGSLGLSSHAEIHDSLIAGSAIAVQIGPETSATFQNTTLQGGSHSVIWADSPNELVVHGCDFVRGSGVVIRAGRFCSLGPVSYDLTNNYWGTTDEAQIQEWIVDVNDDPTTCATVQYSPFAGQSVPAEATSWGELKALFR
jgi:hypothetical protein